MSVDILVPQENVNDQSAVLVGRFVEDGQAVTRGQVIAEMETSKAVFEVVAEGDGILVFEHEIGAEVPVGEVLARILTEEEARASQAEQAAIKKPPPEQTPPEADDDVASTADRSVRAARATPRARKLAASLGVDLSRISKRGVIREKDVLAAQKHQGGGGATGGSAPKWSKPPVEELARWKVLDEDQISRGRLVHSYGFLVRILSGGYGKKLDAPPLWAKIAACIGVCVVAVLQALIWLLAWLPIVGSWVEILARVYKRNRFGFFLRGAYYKAKLKQFGPDNIIDQNVEIWGGRNIRIGRGCHLDMYARLAAGEASQSQSGAIEIHDHVHIGPQAILAGRGGITIGAFTAITAGTKIYSATNVGENPDDPFDLLPMSHAAPLDRQHIVEGAVTIGHHVFVGLNCCILPGVSIGCGAIINSGSVVTSDVPDFAIVGGNPARIMGYRVPREKRVPKKPDESAS